MANLGLVLLIFAFVCACFASRLAVIAGWNLLALAVAFWLAAEIFGGVSHILGVR